MSQVCRICERNGFTKCRCAVEPRVDLHTTITTQRKQLSELQSKHDIAEGLLKKTVIKMNPVTANYRHGNTPTRKAFTKLCDWQLEIEQYLKG